MTGLAPGPDWGFDQGEGGPFYFDASRQLWLGVEGFQVMGYYGSTRTDAYLSTDGGFTFTGTTVYRHAPYKVKCVGITALVGVASSPTFHVRDGTSNVSGGSLALSASTAGTDMTLSSDTIAAGSKISLYVSGTASFGALIYAYFRRVME